MDRSGAPASVGDAPVRVARDQPLRILLRPGRRERSQPGADAADRRAVPGDPVLRRAADDAAPAQERPLRRSGAGAPTDASDGVVGGVSEAAHQRSALGSCGVPVSAAGRVDRSGEPSLVRGHHVYSDAAGVPVSGRGDGLGEPEGSVVAGVEHDGSRFLHRRGGGGVGAVRPARDLQHRSGQPVHQLAVRGSGARRRRACFDGRPGALAG